MHYNGKQERHQNPTRLRVSFDVALAQHCGAIETRRVSEGEARRPFNDTDLYSPSWLAMVSSSALPLAYASGFDKRATSKRVSEGEVKRPLNVTDLYAQEVRVAEFLGSVRVNYFMCKLNEKTSTLFADC